MSTTVSATEWTLETVRTPEAGPVTAGMPAIAFASINRDKSNSNSNNRDVSESRGAINSRVTNKS